MDKIAKTLAKLTEKERAAVRAILEKLAAGTVQGLDMKKLRGSGDVFRVRKGDLRIIYRREGERIFLLAIERRREDTYH